MKTNLKPVIRLGDLIDAGYSTLSQLEELRKIEYLCIPLTRAGKKAAIEAMAEGVNWSGQGPLKNLSPATKKIYIRKAELAFKALIGMDKE